MILLKFKTEIKGDSNIKDHADWITLNSVNFSCGRLVSAHSGGTDRETSTPSFTDIQCKKEFDISSVELFMQSICGKSLGEATLHFMQTGGKDADQVYLKIILEEPIVTSYVHDSNSGHVQARRFRSISPRSKWNTLSLLAIRRSKLLRRDGISSRVPLGSIAFPRKEIAIRCSRPNLQRIRLYYRCSTVSRNNPLKLCLMQRLNEASCLYRIARHPYS